MFVHVCVLGWVCLPGEKQKQGGIFSGQLCAAYPPWWEGVEGHYWFPRQPRQRPDDCERVPGETVKYTQFLLHAESLFKIYANECKKLLRLPRTACYDCFFFFVVFCLSPETHIYLFIFISLALPPAPLSSLLAFPHRLTLPLQICIGKNEEIDGFLRLSSGKKRGLVPVKCLLEIWRCCFRLDPHFVTVMEEYSGVFSQHLTDHQPPASISKMWQWKQCEWKITHNFAFYRSLRPKGCRGFLAII